MGLSHILEIHNPTRFDSLYSDLKLFFCPCVLTTVGAQHRKQQKLLNPVFSDAYMRNMTHLLECCAQGTFSFDPHLPA